MPPPPTRFALDGPGDIVFREWPGENEAVAFHQPTGNLYLLTPLAAAVIKQLERSPATLAEIAAELPAGIDRAELASTVASLADLGMLIPVEP